MQSVSALYINTYTTYKIFTVHTLCMYIYNVLQISPALAMGMYKCTSTQI